MDDLTGNIPTDIKHTYAIYTLADITNTNQRHGDSKERHQQSNYETLWQVIQLRIQPELIEVSIDKLNKDHVFGSKFKGDKKVWKLLFNVDQSGPFGEDNEGLLSDIDGVPFINNLDNNAKLDGVFNCFDEKNTNTYVKLVSE